MPPSLAQPDALPPYPWLGPLILAAAALAVWGGLWMRTRAERVWEHLARDLRLTPQPLDDDTQRDLRLRLYRHVLFMIAGVDAVERHLVGRFDGSDVEVVQFQGFGVGHWAPISVEQAVKHPNVAALHVDATRDRPGFGELSQSVVMLRDARLHLPRFLLSPENMLTRRVPEPAGVDLEGDAYPLFLLRNRIYAADAAAARKLFPRPVQIALERNRDLTLEGDGDTLLLYRVGHHLSAERVKRLLHEAAVLRDLLLQAAGTPR